MSIDILIPEVNTDSLLRIMACYQQGGGNIVCLGRSPRQMQMRNRACKYAAELRRSGELPLGRFGIAMRRTFTGSYLINVSGVDCVDDPATQRRIEEGILKEFQRAPRGGYGA